MIEGIIKTVIVLFIVSIIGYTIVGSPSRVDEIKERAPNGMSERGWKILRYEGWQYGSWYNHGGKVWYHVANLDNPTIQYRVYVTLWDDELHFAYGSPEKLQRIEVNYQVQ